MVTATTRVNVRYQETDKMGIVYYSNYLVWFEIGRTDLFKKMGIFYQDLERSGCFLLVIEVYCKYRAPATYDDELEVLTQLAELKNSALTFNYEIRKRGTLITNGKTKHVFVDGKGKVIKIPAKLVEALNKEVVKNG